MTVCVAALCLWHYGDGGFGSAVVVASDRMMTAGDFEYEPPSVKLRVLTYKCIAVVSGDFTVHSQAKAMALERISRAQTTRISDIAETYASCMREIKMRQAEALYLSPLNLTIESFLDKQRLMDKEIVFELTNKIQNHKIDTEALIVGYDQDAHIYMVDTEGLVSCHDDIGFAAIGLGHYHAKSQFMMAKYHRSEKFIKAVATVYRAKKSAEVAPGVGALTDMAYVTRDHTDTVPTGLLAALQESYYFYTAERDAVFERSTKEAFDRWFVSREERQEEAAAPTSTPARAIPNQTLDPPVPDENRDGSSS